MSRRRSYQIRKLLRHNRKPAELLLVPAELDAGPERQRPVLRVRGIGVRVATLGQAGQPQRADWDARVKGGQAARAWVWSCPAGGQEDSGGCPAIACSRGVRPLRWR